MVDLKEIKAQLVPKVQYYMLVIQVELVKQDLKVQLDMVKQDLKVSLDQLVRGKLDLKDLLDLKVSLVKVLVDLKGTQDHKVRLDHKDLQDQE
jgi:hypothetical protein